MIGTELHKIGENRSVLSYFGDNRGQPFLGPGRIKFLDISTLGIIDKGNGFHLMSVNGTINASITNIRPIDVTNNNNNNNNKRRVSITSSDSDLDSQIFSDSNNNNNKNYNNKNNKNNKNKKRNNYDEDIDDEDNNEMKSTYMNITFCDVTSVPLTRNLAICDRNTDTIKIVNRDDWTIDRSLGQPNLQNPPIFTQLSCIDSFEINYKTYYCASQLDSDRVMILSEGGTILHIIGESGLLPGQFDTPISISSCIETSHNELLSKSPNSIIPGWYLGQSPPEKLIEFMNHRKNHYPRNFRISQRPRVPNIFDVVYISSSGILVNCQIQKNKVTGEAAMITSTGTKLNSYPSIDHLVRNFKEFYQCHSDPRPYVTIGVVDSKNRRVQIFRYYSIESAIYRPEVKLIYVIGGYKNGCGISLNQPTSLSFFSNGNLAICDSGLKSILILSSKMLLLHTIKVPFINSIPKDDIPTPYINCPSAPPYEQIPIDPLTKNPLPHNSPLIDKTPIDVTVSTDGKIAVMYKRGGIIIYKPIKVYSVGIFELLPISCFNQILLYCEYSDYEALRECCVFIHNHTRDLRNRWSLSPLGGRRREIISIFQFMKWAIIPSRDTRQFGKNSPIKSNDLSPLDRMIFYDKNGKECCSRYWIEEPLQPTDLFEIKSKFGKSRTKCCQNIVCTLSHEDPVVPYYFLRLFTAYINYSCTLLAINRLFDNEFIWKKEPYIQHLFTALSDMYNIEKRHDPMSRKNEVIRNISYVNERHLDFDGFMELMRICEEDSSNAKPFRRQFLFHKIRIEKITPNLMKENTMLSLLENGNISHQIHSDEDLSQLLHVNPIWQYKDGIYVPYKKKLNKKYRQIENVDKEERGINESEDNVHNFSFLNTVNKAESLIDKLFS